MWIVNCKFNYIRSDILKSAKCLQEVLNGSLVHSFMILKATLKNAP